MYLRYVVGATEEVLVQGAGGFVPPHAALVTIHTVRYRVVELEYAVNHVPQAVGNEPQILTVVTVWLEVEDERPDGEGVPEGPTGRG